MKVQVCPICWRGNCRMFLRLQGLKFTNEEKTKFFKAFHRDVCHICRKLAFEPGHMCKPKKFGKRRVLPGWWLGDKP